MTMPRRQLVDVAVTRFYHCISRCVRHMFLCGDRFAHRKGWIESRLEFLSTHFAISVCGFAILDNHLHVLCRLDPDVADGWSEEEVVRRWVAVFRPSCLDVDDPDVLQAWIDDQCRDPGRVACYRERLQNLGWFMKALKEPLARRANKEEGCTGTFWQARYKSIAILDEEALLATCAYIDLNPVAAGIEKIPEAARHTSIKQRVDHVRKHHALGTLKLAAEVQSVAAARVEADLEQSHWLCPLQDRSNAGARREGMLPGFSLSGYLELVDWTARLCRTGKVRITEEVAGIMARLGTTAECWHSHLRKLMAKTRWVGHYCATSAERLKTVAKLRGVHHLENALGSLVTQ